MTNWDKFDKAIDTEGLAKDVAASAEGSGTFKEVPHGDYEVKIEKMELKESKKGDPMVQVWFKVLSGEFQGNRIFMNQVITQGFQIHIVNEFFRSLGTDLPIEFKTYAQYGQMIMDLAEMIDGVLEFALEYGENKGYSTFKITDVYEVE